jgi:hypothetical protein
VRPERPEGISRQKVTPFQVVLGRAKALIVEMLTPVSLSFHQLNKGLQVIFRGSDITFFLERRLAFSLAKAPANTSFPK